MTRNAHRAAVEAGYASLPEYVEQHTPIDLTQFEGHTPEVRVTKCPCGHHACTSWQLSTQGSSGFDEADARLYAAAPALLAEVKRLREENERIYERLAHWINQHSIERFRAGAAERRAVEAAEAIQMFLDCDAFIPSLVKQSQDDLDAEEERRFVVRNKLERAMDAIRPPPDAGE